MIKRIELINFMSHRHTVIEPAKGLTVIVGENNTGKSALISALQVLCRNAPGDYMVSHGERECIIRVVTEEEDEIEWKRKNRTVSYVINGTDIHRLGGGVPDALHERLRLGLVETEGDPFEIHFGEQKKPIFLLNESPSRRATFFASSSDTIKLIEMQNLHRRNVQDAKTLENELVRREAELHDRMGKLVSIDALGQFIDDLEKQYGDIADDMDAAVRLYEKIDALEYAREVVSRFIAMASATAFLSPPPSFSDTAGIKDLIEKIVALSIRRDKNADRIEAYRPLAPPPEMADVSTVGAIIRRFEKGLSDVMYYEVAAGSVSMLTPPPEMADVDWLRNHIRKMTAAAADCKSQKDAVEKSNREIAEAGRLLAACIEKQRICPTCGQEMDPALFIGTTPLVAGRKK